MAPIKTKVCDPVNAYSYPRHLNLIANLESGNGGKILEEMIRCKEFQTYSLLHQLCKYLFLVHPLDLVTIFLVKYLMTY